MKLVITEKPSVAQTVAKVIGAVNRADGYLTGNGYVVSWCFGHLAGLARAEQYNDGYAKWTYEDLPIIPETWKFNIGKDKKKQFEILRRLINSSDITEVINACDAGREGELIFRNVYNLVKCRKPMKRLWISSMEDTAIHEGFNNLRSGSDYDNLYNAALCRSKADWIVGINATRLFSVLYHRTLNVGRVMSPTLAMLVQREAEIENFKSEPFYKIALDCGMFRAESERFNDKSAAEVLAQKCKNSAATVRTVDKKDKKENAPTLYDLTTLQRDANRILGYTAQQTLDYLQALYEKKLCTYPRTDSKFLTDDMKDTVKEIVSISALIIGAAVQTINADKICNSKKVSDHHAVILTKSVSGKDLTTLSEGEKNILSLLARRTVCAVSEPHTYIETTAQLICADTEFQTKGKTIKNLGWRIFLNAGLNTDEKPDSLPELREGQALTPSGVSVTEGKTTPPKHYTEDTILSAMEKAGSEDMPDEAERKGLGTPATRAGIIEKLVSVGFVSRQKAQKTINLIPSDTGKTLVSILPEQLKSPLLTAVWEQQLLQVEKGQLLPQEFMAAITDMTIFLVHDYRTVESAEKLFPPEYEVIGKCPRCGSNVIERKKGYFCEKNDCNFALWKDNLFFSSKRVKLTKKIVKSFLQNKAVFMNGLYSEKKDKLYDAYVIMHDDGEKTSFRLDFNI